MTRQSALSQRLQSRGCPRLQDVTACYHGAAQPVKDNDGVYVVNLRSDTFTMPTTAMKDAMVTAPLGDDVYEEDPTVNSQCTVRRHLILLSDILSDVLIKNYMLSVPVCVYIYKFCVKLISYTLEGVKLVFYAELHLLASGRQSGTFEDLTSWLV